MVRDSQFHSELRKLRDEFGTFNVNMIFDNIENYKTKRTYMTFKQITDELDRMFVE